LVKSSGVRYLGLMRAALNRIADTRSAVTTSPSRRARSENACALRRRLCGGTASWAAAATAPTEEQVDENGT
jgi:hypothetical protein